MTIEIGKLYKFIDQNDNVPYGTLCTALEVHDDSRWATVVIKRHDISQHWTVGACQLERYVDAEEVVSETYDSVNKPKHYQLLPGVEVIDVLDALCDKLDNSTLLYNKEVSYYTQMMGYLMRFMDKNGLEDLKKARWYLDRIIRNLEAQNDH